MTLGKNQRLGNFADLLDDTGQNVVPTVGTLGGLPVAADNNGKTYYVDSLGRLKSDGSSWLPVETLFLRNTAGGDTAALIQSAVDLGADNICLIGLFEMSSSVFVPVGQKLHASRATRFVPLAGASFTQGFMFIFNSSDGLTWDDDFPNIDTGGFSGGYFDNSPNVVTGVKACLGFGSCEFENLRGNRMAGMVKRPAGVYSDNFKVRRVYCEPVIGADYQIDIIGLGDCPVIEECHFPFNAANPGSGTPNGVKVSASLGGKIADCIGGNVLISGGGKVTVERGHYEKSKILINASSAEIKSTFMSADSGEPIETTDDSAQDHHVSLEDVEFAYTLGANEWSGADVKLDNRFTLSVKNCYRRFTVSGSIDKSQLSGISVVDSGGSAVTDWNNFSYALSRNGFIGRNYNVDLTFTLVEKSNSYSGIGTSALDGAVSWGEATGTYYYTSQVLTDKGRLLGRTQISAEESIAATNGGNGVRLDLSYGDRVNSGIVRVYRGTSTGSYNKYVDIPAFSMGRLYDDGVNLNGYPWVSRSAGAVDTLNAIGLYSSRYQLGIVELRASAPPTVGAWTQADTIYRTNPAAAGKIGWVVTTAGSPGTIKQFGAIDP